jgi:hypothetical protein
MEDDLKKKMEDDLNKKWKTSSTKKQQQKKPYQKNIEDEQKKHGRRPKKIKMEDNLKRKWGKNEDDIKKKSSVLDSS